MTHLLFVGYRPGARQAAERRGIKAKWLLDASKTVPRPLQSEDWVQVDFQSSEQAITALTEQFSTLEKPLAVVALTEKAVVPAAMIRQALGVDGLSIAAAHRCHDKVRMKQTLQAAELRCAPFRLIDASTSAQSLIDELGLPLVLKQRDSSGSRGTIVARTSEQVAENLTPGWMAEGFIDGYEFSVESLVVDGKPIFTNITEYLNPGWANIVPAQNLDAHRDAIEARNRDVIKALGVERGITHHELFITADGLVTGELAARPPGGYLMQLVADAYEFDMWEALLDVESGQLPEVIQQAKSVQGMYILHPGEGHCIQITGLEEARLLPNITHIHCSLKPGQFSGPRLGVGQSAACIFARGATRAQVVDALEAARAQIIFELNPLPPHLALTADDPP